MELEQFIRSKSNEFDDNYPHEDHNEKFLVKLQRRFKQFISIVPYLIKVLIVTILVFIGSIVLWNEYIRKDRHEITLKQKISITTRTIFGTH
jgi:hypothetical protein